MAHDITVTYRGSEWVADATQDEETGAWTISISRDGWDYDGNDVVYPTQQAALLAALDDIREDVQEEASL